MLIPLLNALTGAISAETILVLDDYHLVSKNNDIIELTKKLVDYCPPHLHIVLSTRYMPEFPDINRWRVKGKLNTIGVSDLAFTAEEIEVLFNEKYHYPITTQQAELLAAETEGWTIALQMIWQSLQSGIIPGLETALLKPPTTFDHLFDYLAPEVLARQTADIQRFLITTSILRQMDGPSCDALLETQDSQKTLKYLHEIGLFVDLVGERTYRYQRLFHDFLLNLAGKDPQQKKAMHRRAAQYYDRANQPEENLHHLFGAGDYVQAADLIEKIGGNLLLAGRLDSLNYWLEHTPAELRASRPFLELLYGDVCRQKARFETALQHYQLALGLYQDEANNLGQSQAISGQAQVYLDTVRPLQAVPLLAEALDLLDPAAYAQETADLLEMLAENKLNAGMPDQAKELHRESLRLHGEAKSADIYLETRILLRTGKLAESQRLLESYKLDEQLLGQNREVHFHREKELLLSLVCVLQGNQADAERYAREGIAIGQNMQSTYVEAVGFMRLGHALQLGSFSPWGGDQRQAAIDCYESVMGKIRPFKVARVGLEPLWGLCRAYGYAGDLEVAEGHAVNAIELATSAGDEWFGHYVRIIMGASYAMSQRPQVAARWLNEAAEGLVKVQDTYAWSAAKLWLSLNAWWSGQVESALQHLSALLGVVAENGYDSLLIKPTHAGLKDDQAAIPLLMEAYRQGIQREFVLKLLSRAGKAGLEFHPGYTLWVRTLGPFNLWRGDDLVTSREWQREKARQLFQLLITSRGQWLLREQIMDMLWPESTPESALSDFKVALNALNRAIEPTRPRNLKPYFIIRQGNAYGINPQASIVTDGEVFSQMAALDNPEKMQAALNLYEEDYLPDCLYCDWSSIERGNYRQQYLNLAERLARAYLQAQQWNEALAVCTGALRRDRFCEPAYGIMMQVHTAQGNLPQAEATYQHFKTILEDELGIEPSVSIQRLHQMLTLVN